ncbi:MAG: T9SS type A sorting domain-containing protein [Cytophagaceae bacterium]|nr:T9SS type A sorting domain-containing protein [Cytophagaceae bacterium]
MKQFFALSLISVLFILRVGAQTPAVTFTQLPNHLQLYPRTAQNTADVPVAGFISSPGYSKISLRVFRNNQPFAYRSQALAYTNNQAVFSLNATLRAELAEYSFEVFAVETAGDSVRLARRDSVVCGDAFVIMGQSNAITIGSAVEEYTYRSEFSRSFGSQNVTSRSSDTLWTLSERNGALVGVWGMELQRLITQTYQVPVCIINGGVGGTPIDFHYRNEANPTDLNTAYGRVLYRTQKAGLTPAVRAIFWRQGEAEGYFNRPGYNALFDPIYQAWNKDYAGLQWIYLFQNNIIDGPSQTAGEVLEFQRRSASLYPKVVNLATVGTLGYDGVHYNAVGYIQTARQVFRLVGRDFYGSTDTLQITSPNLVKAFFTTPERKEIRLIFGVGQSLRWQSDSTLRTQSGTAYTRRMIDFIYLDDVPGLVRQGEASGNIVTLTLDKSSTAQRINYLPGAFKDEFSGFYDGPHIRNSRALAAFAFHQVSLADGLPVPDLSATADSTNRIRLAWVTTGPNPVGGYQLERSDNLGATFRLLATLPATANSYTDTQNLLRGHRYQYRMKSVSAASESPYDGAEATTDGLQVLTFYAKPVSPTAIQLGWSSTQGAPGFTHSILERSTQPVTGFQPVARLDAPVTLYVDSTLLPNTQYYYRVRTVRETTESSPATANARTLTVTSLSPPMTGELAMFPNPAHERVVIRLRGNAPAKRIQLMDVTGKTVLKKNSAGSEVLLEWTSLPAGLYLLRVETDTAVFTQKLVIE